MMDPWRDVCTLVMISAMNGYSVAEQLLYSIIAYLLGSCFMMDAWTDVITLVMISAMNGSSVAE